ncbi:hypothetical protein CZ797_07750 [Pseudoalteromonas sp. JB197]|nr:hypothetical protein CZ797_07750 [Pseudoalteromonas sp. JB197]
MPTHQFCGDTDMACAFVAVNGIAVNNVVANSALISFFI